MNFDMFEPRNETEGLVRSITKNFETFIKKPQ